MGFKAIPLMGFILGTALNSFLKEKTQPTKWTLNLAVELKAWKS